METGAFVVVRWQRHVTRRLFFFIAAGTILPSIALATANPERFHAEVGIARPITGTSELRPYASSGWSMRANISAWRPDAPVSILNASNVRIEISEIGVGQGAAVGTLLREDKETDLDAHNLDVRVLEMGPAATVILGSNGSATWRVPAAYCMIHPWRFVENASNLQANDLLQTLPNPFGPARPRVGVDGAEQQAEDIFAHCQVQSLATWTNGLASLLDMTVELRIAHQNGTVVALPVRLGEFTEPDPTAPLVQRTIRRTAVITPLCHPTCEATNSSWDLRSPPGTTIGIDVQAPALQWVGKIQMPPFVGEAILGTRLLDRKSESNVNGAFTFSSSRPDQLTIDGLAANSHATPSESGAQVPLKETARAFPAALAGALVLILLRFWPAVFAFFSRISADASLNHPKRAALVALLRENPGIGVNEACRILGLRAGLFDYHLRVLLRNNIVVRRKFGSSAALFLAEHADPNAQAVTYRLRDETMAKLVEAIRQNPRLSQRGLAAQVGVNQAYVSRAIRQLRDLGILSVEPVGRQHRYQILKASSDVYGDNEAPGLAPGSTAFT